MKTSFAACACVFLLVASIWAIPQTFGSANNRFSQRLGMNFEQFAADPAAWGVGSELKEHWAAHGDTLTLRDSAAVFGVPADQVTAQQKDGQVQSFRVVFRGGEKKAGKPADLAGQLTANVRAFTGDSGTKISGGGSSFKYKAVTITLWSGSSREVVVEFKRA